MCALALGAKKLECSEEIEEMARSKNEILVEWLDSKDIRKRNRVNIKHVVGETSSITPGAIITVKFKSKRYKASIIDLIDWTAPKKHCEKAQKSKDSIIR